MLICLVLQYNSGWLQTFLGQISSTGKSSFSHRALPRSRRAEEERKKTSPLDWGKAFLSVALLLAALDKDLACNAKQSKKELETSSQTVKKCKRNMLLFWILTFVIFYTLTQLSLSLRKVIQLYFQFFSSILVKKNNYQWFTSSQVWIDPIYLNFPTLYLPIGKIKNIF